MTSRLNLFVVGCALLSVASSAAINNEVAKIRSGEELISSIMDNCFSDFSVMSCLKGKVLTYLDSVLGLQSENARSFDDKYVDHAILDRVARIVAENEFKVQMDDGLIVTYRVDRGLDYEVSQTEGRGLLKKKLLFPILLLLKLKMKALMPILVAIIGLKAMKALILSKLAITIVLGFLISQLLKKKGMDMPMAMMPTMMSADPMTAYGAPAPGTTQAPPSSSYDPASWEPAASSGGPYSRIWDPSQSSHSLAYSSYYPSSSSSSSSLSSDASSSSLSSSKSSLSSTAHAY